MVVDDPDHMEAVGHNAWGVESASAPEPDSCSTDPVLRHLLSSLLPAIAKPEEAHPLFLDHVALALTAHMAHVYGGMVANAGLPRGGLARWQERRANELMRATLNKEIPLSRLAKECGLSVRHFARRFRQSTGGPPTTSS